MMISIQPFYFRGFGLKWGDGGAILRRFWNFLVEASSWSRGRNGGRGRVLPPLLPLWSLD